MNQASGQKALEDRRAGNDVPDGPTARTMVGATMLSTQFVIAAFTGLL